MGAKNGLGHFHDDIQDVRQPTEEEREAALRYMTKADALDLLEYLFPQGVELAKPAGDGE